MSRELHEKDFAGCINDNFHVLGEHHGALSLQLIQIAMEPAKPEQHVFSLLFRGSVDPLLPQRTYQLKHHQLGEVDIFLVPVGQDKEGCTYQAVFNHLVHSTHE